MVGVQSLYSAEQKDTITTSDINAKVKSILEKLSEKDKKLFRFAKTKISEEAGKLNIINATIIIDFLDYGAFEIRKEDEARDSTQVIRIAMDEGENCTLVWEKEWFCRRVFKTVINADFTFLKNIAGYALPILAAYGKAKMIKN